MVNENEFRPTRRISFAQWCNQTATILGYPVLIAIAALVVIGTGAGAQAGSCKLFGRLCTSIAVADDLAGALYKLDRDGYALDIPTKLKKK